MLFSSKLTNFSCTSRKILKESHSYFSGLISSMASHPDKKIATYESTVATGLEWVARDEVKQKLQCDAKILQGRVFFSTDRPIKDLLKLKSINNLFVIIFDEMIEADEMPVGADIEPLLTKVGDKCDWLTGLTKWRELTNFNCSMDKLLTKDLDLRSEQPKFRVSCNRHGPEHKFTSPEICTLFGHVLDQKFGWPIKMKGYDLEVMVTFSINHVYVGLTLTPIALDRRNIVDSGLTTLKAPTCYALLRTANIQCGDIVVDPMAGSGAIPVECCFGWDEEWLPFSIAGELKRIPLDKCRTNLNTFTDVRPPSDIIQLDVTSLPFRIDSIDVFVSDLPFGRRHGSKKNNRTLYPKLLRDMARVARVGQARAVLLTQDVKSINLAYDLNKDYWIQKFCSFVKVGNLSCYMYLFVRNSVNYKKTQEERTTVD